MPNFLFGPLDVAVTLGPDGLVINTAKYLDGQPLVAFNPDPSRIDGVLIPFGVDAAADVLKSVVWGRFATHAVTMAQAELNDGQAMYAVNDLFIGARSHVSARYRLRFGAREENQSSSGIIVSTGAGSAGWLRSILTGAAGVVEAFTGPAIHQPLAPLRHRCGVSCLERQWPCDGRIDIATGSASCDIGGELRCPPPPRTVPSRAMRGAHCAR